MEISESTNNRQQKYFAYIHTFITFFGALLILVLIIYAIYLLERNILFFPINKLFRLILSPFISSDNNLVITISILIFIFIHIKFFQIIIRSFVFLYGGIFARFFFYEEFINVINQQIKSANELHKCLFLSTNNNMINYFNNLLLFQKALNNLKKEKKETFEINQIHFSEILNNIIFLFEKYQEKNYEDENIQNNLINKLILYQKSIYPYTQFSYLDIFIKFYYYRTQSFLKELFLISFHNRVCSEIIISQDFKAYMVYPEENGIIKNNNSNLKTLLIFCCQNGLSVETFSINKNKIQFFLDIKEMTILLWNYTGYGTRSGITSFSNIDKDVNDLKNFIINNYPEYKIIIHGISIGGYPAIKLAKSLNEFSPKYKSNLCLIADRTYSDIDLIVESFNNNYGYILKNIYNFIFPKCWYHSDNVQNYIDVFYENKFVFYNEEDKIIEYNKSSLIYNLTVKYYQDIILPKISKFKQFNKLKNMTKNDIENIKTYMKRIKNSINNENFNILFKNINKNDFKHFLMFFLVFGYPFNKNKEVFYDKTIFAKNYIEIPLILKEIYDTNKINFNTNLFEFFSDLNFLFIKSNLFIPFTEQEIIDFKYNNDSNEFLLQENVTESLLKYFGFVHRIFCGHNEAWNNNDELYIKIFLELKGFINTQ